MARIRSIKPELRTSITVSLWPREVRYFFILLWGYLDDYGRGVDDELLIASDCFPRDRDATPEVIDGWLETIAEAGPLCRYEVDGRRYLHAPNWREHQKPSHPTRSKIPPCPEDEPDDFKKWREVNPQRLRNRSRKSREGFAKIPEPSTGPSGSPSGEPSGAHLGAESDETAPGGSSNAEEAIDWSELPGQDATSETLESLPNSSRNAPEYFAPEQGSKGAREQGVKPPAHEVESAATGATAVADRGISDRMADAFMDRFRKGNSYRRYLVRQTITAALENDTDPDELWAAMVRLGELSKPVTINSLQFAFSEIRSQQADNVVQMRPSTATVRYSEGQALAAKFRAEEQRALEAGSNTSQEPA
ncbi:hypothetical protein O3Q52_17405 [Streptomyces sp. ActVer]|uniref:hypothetical protein n=1 Tax=Streptomyces sp. ActVer TaxID=3014558 RepID=UPI0022B2DC99|nr:hypothetical protein [Streptomyces sp. ActVer]MCZ4509942.1 hypothetical protein [Streptomyces sp. ActVer]